MLAPMFGGELKSCHGALSASEVMNSLLIAPSEKILSSSVSALDGHGDRGVKCSCCRIREIWQEMPL